MDKATPLHYKSQKIRSYLEKHKDVLIPVWLPTAASPEFMVLEECWNIKERPSGTDILFIIQRICKINRRIFQNKTFQSEYEELSACKHWLENIG